MVRLEPPSGSLASMTGMDVIRWRISASMLAWLGSRWETRMNAMPSFVPVVDVGGVRVVMVKWFVEMRVRMITGCFSLVGVPSVFGVMVQVLVLDRDMVVLMRVPFSREHQGPCNHQAKCNYELQVRISPNMRNESAAPMNGAML